MAAYLQAILEGLKNHEQIKREEDQRAKANQPNWLNVLLGGAIGGLTGGTGSALLGALGGLGTTPDQGLAGTAQTGLNAFQVGTSMKEALAKKAAFSSLAGTKPADLSSKIMGNEYLLPEFGKTVIEKQMDQPKIALEMLMKQETAKLAENKFKADNWYQKQKIRLDGERLKILKTGKFPASFSFDL